MLAGGVGTSGPDGFGLLVIRGRARRSRPYLDQPNFFGSSDVGIPRSPRNARNHFSLNRSERPCTPESAAVRPAVWGLSIHSDSSRRFRTPQMRQRKNGSRGQLRHQRFSESVGNFGGFRLCPRHLESPKFRTSSDAGVSDLIGRVGLAAMKGGQRTEADRLNPVQTGAAVADRKVERARRFRRNAAGVSW
jgi:hypothetical protein